MESFLIILCLLITFLALYLFIRLKEMKAQVKVRQRKIDQMENHSGFTEDPLNDDLRKLIEEGKDVKAVKMAREAWGLSLVEGKRYIDGLKAEADK